MKRDLIKKVLTDHAQNCSEMKKFRSILDKHGIEWHDMSDLSICRTRFRYKDNEWSVIHGHGTYGGWTAFEEDAGLLEVYAVNSNNEPEGWMTAQEVWEHVSC